MELLDTVPFWVLALAVFLARVTDVTLGTMRMIAVVHGHAIAAVALGLAPISQCGNRVPIVYPQRCRPAAPSRAGMRT